MDKARKEINTDSIIHELRILAERLYRSRKRDAELLIRAADRLEELDERIAIMTEPSLTDADMSFPPEE